MRIGRTLPPAASPIYIRDIIYGIKGLIRGQKEIERFRSELKDFYGVKHCFLVSSGKAALTLILRALHELHPERDEVLIPAFICYSVPSAIVRAGLKVKLCDVNPDTLDFNYENLEKILSEKPENDSNQLINQSTNQPNAHSEANKQQRTIDNGRHQQKPLLAVLGAHLFGLPSDMVRIRELVDDLTVTVVEDAAQVLGSTWKGKKLGTQGDVSFFSLGRGKALSTVEGGIIITNRDDIGQNIRTQLEEIPGYDILELVKLIFNAILLIVFQNPFFFWFPKSLPFLKVGDTFYDPEFKIRKMTGFQAGLTRNWRTRLADFQKQRKKWSLQWALTSSPDNARNYASQNGSIPDFIRYPLKIKDTSKWQETLKVSEKQGLGVMLTYPDSINGIDELKEEYTGQTYPVAEKLVRQLLTLPVHPYVSRNDVNNILKLFAKMPGRG